VRVIAGEGILREDAGEFEPADLLGALLGYELIDVCEKARGRMLDPAHDGFRIQLKAARQAGGDVRRFACFRMMVGSTQTFLTAMFMAMIPGDALDS